MVRSLKIKELTIKRRRHRLLLNPAFTDEKLSSTVAYATNKTIKEYFSTLKQTNIRDVSEDMSNITLDIIGRAGFGYEFDTVARKTVRK